MSEYYKIKSLSSSLNPLYLSQKSFWNRFVRISRAEDPFVRAFDICEDTFRHGSRVAIKDYSSCTEQGCEDVLMNLESYQSFQKIEEICKLVAFCQEQGTGDIRAAFQYSDLSLQQLIENRYCQQTSYEFYQFLLQELFISIQSFKNIGITLEELVPSSILLEKRSTTYKVKILYDEREKKFDKIQEGIKVFCSPEKVNAAIRQQREHESLQCQEVIFQFGLLLLDIVYCYESSAPRISQATHQSNLQPSSLSSTALFKSYLIFQNINSCYLNDQLICFKLEYIKSLNSVFLDEFASIVRKMISGVNSRISLQDLDLEIKKIDLFRKNKSSIRLEIPFFQGLDKEISPIKSKEESNKQEDSLRYSPSYNSEKYLKKPLISQTTVPTLNGISNFDKAEYEENKLDFFVIPKESLLSTRCHCEINKKLQIFIIELQGKVSLTKKDYYDNNIYYGEINPITQKRAGLGIYVYKHGDIYFGLWRDNSLMEGTYIFKNGDCFEGYVKNGKQGRGKYYYANGNIYEGEWQDDLKHGLGKLFYSNGDSYEGLWHKGKKHGYGTYFYRSGTIYRGIFHNGKKHGIGIVDFSDGTKIEALWVANTIEGKGKIFYKNGDFFQGTFNYSLKEGQGEYRWTDCTRYEGFFRKDLMDGQAKIRFEDNEYYEGHIVEGKREGQGLYRYSNGDEFKGTWKNDQKSSGLYVYCSGGSFEGKFKEGEMSYGAMLYPNGESFEGEFFHGERHGKGVYRSASGVVKFDGQWNRDRFVS